MKRLFKLIGTIGFILVFSQIFAGCGTVGGYIVSHTFRLGSGNLPIGYFQAEKGKTERMVYISPVLLPDQQQSYLYIITNPEDVEKAQAKMDSQKITSMAAVNKALEEFSPIFIRSNNLELLFGPRVVDGNGLAVFHLPSTAEKLFYAYLSFGKDAKLSPSYTLKVWHDVLPLASLPENVFMRFSDGENDLDITAVTGGAEVAKLYNGTMGSYATYMTSGFQTVSREEDSQLGFISATMKQRALTYEEFEKVALAYAETVSYIEQKGKVISFNQDDDRQGFIQKYQGRPDTAKVAEAIDAPYGLQWNKSISKEEIVVIAKKEPDAFKRVRIIHDWVANLFYYDWDLLKLMDTYGQANFTLDGITKTMRGVCFEYAILFWNLMDAAGIDTYLIKDYPLKHAYNMVVINGTGYIVDTTWDSNNHYQNGQHISSGGMFRRLYCMPGITESYEYREAGSQAQAKVQ